MTDRLDVQMFMDGYNLGRDSNQISLAGQSTVGEGLTFEDVATDGEAWSQPEALALSFGGSVSGHVPNAVQPVAKFFEFKDQVAVDFGVGVGKRIVEGQPAFAGRVLLTNFEPGNQVGELAAFSVRYAGKERIILGPALANREEQATSETRPSQNLGAVSATQKIRAQLFVWGVEGTNPQIIAKIRSAATSGMGGAVDRITFATYSVTGAAGITDFHSEYKELAGSITDAHWDVDVAISGTSPKFSYCVIAAID